MSETCSRCGQPKPIKLTLVNEETGEDQNLCEICANRFLLSEEEWGSPTKIELIEVYSPLGTKSYESEVKTSVNLGKTR